MSSVAVYSRTHSITYVADNLLKSLKDIVRLSGLNPAKMADQWSVLLAGVRTWLESGHLERLVLEIYNPLTDALIFRWDIDIVYDWTGGDGSVWTDTDQLKYAIRKHGIGPASADYGIVVTTKPGRADVHGWSGTALRSTSQMVRQSLGSTIEHSGLAASTSYWRAR